MLSVAQPAANSRCESRSRPHPGSQFDARATLGGPFRSLSGERRSRFFPSPRYNSGTLKRLLTSGLFLLLLVAPALAQNASHTVLVLPFDNVSKAPGLDWIGESFAETLGQRMALPSYFLIGRDERDYAYDRMGIPVRVHPSRATMIHVADQLDADYLVFGTFNYDGQTFSCSGRVLDVKKMRLLPAARESGKLVNVVEVQSALAWDLLRQIDPALLQSRNDFVQSAPAVRLDAFESFIRGVIATDAQEKVRYFQDAIRQKPGYTQAVLELAKTYFQARDYDDAVTWFAKVPKSDDDAREANFYLGLSAYYIGQFERAENAFGFVADQLPLSEIYNNLGVVAGRRGRSARELQYFQKVVDADPHDADYLFNYAVALYKSGNNAAVRELKDALAARPGDTEAQSFLASLSGSQPGTLHLAAESVPLERIKANYDENSFRQLAMEIYNTQEVRLAKLPPRDHAAAHVSRGLELLTRGFAGEAAKDFQEAVLLDPTNAMAHTGLARSLENSDPAAARSEAQAALQLSPTPDAYLVLARLDLKDNNVQGAGDNAARALQLDPRNAPALQLKQQIAAKLAEKAQPLPHP